MIIGKGGMSESDYKTLFVPVGAVYLCTVGYGTGALLGRGIKRVREVHWLEELGIAQAMWVFEVDRFGPLLVDSDVEGNSLFERNNREINANLDRLYAGLKKPSLSRFGETDERSDELI
jgi:L(+)-tartrate dehydratase beta subunit